MKAEERKQKFVELLGQLLEGCGGVKKKLAQKLDIKPSTLTPWLQGKIDPASLDLAVFLRVAEVAQSSTDELAKTLGIGANSEVRVLDKFRSLVQDLLSGQSLEQLGKKLGVNYSTISVWTSSQRNIDPRRIPISTIAALAIEKGWTIERLLVYLGLKNIEEIKENLLSEIQGLVVQLSLFERVKLLTWLSSEFEKELKGFNAQIPDKSKEKILSDLKVCIVLEDQDLSLASSYSGNLVFHTQLRVENIALATPPSMPESLEDFHVLIFDINSQQSPCIPLVESLEFEGDIVIFADASLPDDVRDRLDQKATELIIKPVPWSELKDLPYFS